MTKREFNTYQILIYTLSKLIIELIKEMKADDPDALKIVEVLQKRVDLIDSGDVNSLFKRTKIVSVLKEKFQYIIYKEFGKMKLELSERKTK